MLNLIKSFFSKKAPTKYSTIQVKYLNEDISIFYKGKILTPNLDYSGENISNGTYLVKFSKVLNKSDIEVFNCITTYYNKKTSLRPWGFKKYQVVTK